MTTKEIRFEKVVEGMPIFRIVIISVLSIYFIKFMWDLVLVLDYSPNFYILMGFTLGVGSILIFKIILEMIDDREVYYRRIR